MSGHSPRPTPTYALGGFGGWNGAHGAEGESHGGRDETRPDTQDVTVVLAVALATLGLTVGEDLHLDLARRPSLRTTSAGVTRARHH